MGCGGNSTSHFLEMNRVKLIYWFLLIALIVSCMVSFSSGNVSIEIRQLIAILLKPLGYTDSSVSYTYAQETVFWTIRMPRVLSAVVVGIALGASGTALQGIFRNPLVDAGLIGIASGASLFASLFIVISSSIPFLLLSSVQLTTAFMAFIGAALTAFLVYRISIYKGKVNITILILGGVALNAVCGALTGLLTYFADDKQLRDLTFWTLGSVSGATWRTLIIMVFFVFIPLIFLMRTRKSLNAFALGENPAHFMGVNVRRTKFIVIICATAMVGACVAFSGVISFVGLVTPHILRLIIGPNHMNLMPLSALAGGVLVCWADLISRNLLPPTDIPIGIITSLIGTPVLLAIILKQKRSLFA